MVLILLERCFIESNGLRNNVYALIKRMLLVLVSCCELTAAKSTSFFWLVLLVNGQNIQ